MAELYLDLSAGAAGDMILAALIDCGVDSECLRNGLRSLAVEGWTMDISAVTRGGLRATLVDVIDHNEARQEKPGHNAHHFHLVPPHKHAHSPGHEHVHSEEPSAHHHAGPNRHLADLLRILNAAPLSPTVKKQAEKVFRLLAEAEGHVHGKPPEEIHFHEISGIDTLLDVVGVCLALELLGVTNLRCSIASTGSGSICCAHGVLPVPAPATLEILKRCCIPCTTGVADRELLTPTGAALIGTLASGFGPAPDGVIQRSGYGAGHAELPGRANVVRAILLDDAQGAGGGHIEEIIEYRAAIDDLPGEAAGYLLEECYAAGALEAYFLPAVMKKSRPGAELVILARPAEAATVETTVLGSGATLGIRRRRTERVALERTTESTEVAGSLIRVKIGSYRGKVVSVKAEYEDCAQIARQCGLPLEHVRQQAEQKFLPEL